MRADESRPASYEEPLVYNAYGHDLDKTYGESECIRYRWTRALFLEPHDIHLIDTNVRKNRALSGASLEPDCAFEVQPPGELPAE